MKKNVPFVLTLSLILLYSTLNIVLLVHHEPYEDEAQAWLIARDLDVASILKQVAYEGTPALWHMLLSPLAKLGMPYISEFILHLVIAIAAVAVFIVYAPFSRLTKVLFTFSYYMAYEYSIVARSYSLSILLLFLIAALYSKRFEYPLWYSLLIFLLFNTNVHSFFISFSLTVLFAWELYRNSAHRGRTKIAVLAMCLGGLVAFLQLLYPPDSANGGIVTQINVSMPLIAVANAFLPWSLFVHGEIGTILRVMSFLMFCAVIFSMAKKNAVLFILLLSLAGLFYLFAFKFPGAMRHHGLILIIIFFALWVSRYYSDSAKEFTERLPNINLSRIAIIIINVCLAVSFLYSLKIQYWEYKYSFSGAKEMATFMKRNHLDNYNVAAHRSDMTASLLPYLPGKKFWYADIEDYGTFISCNKKYLAGRDISDVQVISRLEKAFPDKSDLLLLLTRPIDCPESHGFTLLYKVDKGVFGYNREQFYLYNVSKD